MLDYAKTIKEYRYKEFLTQEDLAKILGVSVTSITRWENGKFEPTMKMKKVLNKLFIEAGLAHE